MTETENAFIPGDRVKITSTSKYYVSNEIDNPKDLSGTIFENNQSNSLNYGVKWDNNTTNGYSVDDLEFA